MARTVVLPDPPERTVVPGPGPDAPPTTLAQNLIFVLVDDAPPISPFKSYVQYDPEDDNPDDTSGGSTARFPSCPTIEGLADNGVIFPYCFGAPVCSPTRAGWMTGLYSFHHGLGTVVREDTAGDLAEFRDTGYDFPTFFDSLPLAVKRGFFGKMHFSIPDTKTFTGSGPHSGRAGAGFGILAEMGPLDSWSVILRNVLQDDGIEDDVEIAGGTGAERNYFNFGVKVDSAPPTRLVGTYNTTFVFDAAINFVQSLNAGQRFFAYIPCNCTHTPHTSDTTHPTAPYSNYPPTSLVNTAEYNTKFAAENADQWAHYLAGMEAIDTELGRLLASLDEETRKTTTVVVMSDNGLDGSPLAYGRDNHGKRYGGNWNFTLDAGQSGDPVGDPNRVKGNVYHWGANTWLVWSGPTDGTEQVANPGRSSKVLVNVQDLFPTFLKYFGEESPDIPQTDGVDFLDEAWFGGTAQTAHARRELLSEVFQPLGDWTLAPLETNYQLNRRYSLVLDGSEGIGVTAGTYTLIRREQDEGTAPDELYLTYDANGDPADIFERTPLDTAVAYAIEYSLVVAGFDALLDTGAGSGEALDITLDDGSSKGYWVRRLNLDGSLYFDDETGLDDALRIGVTDSYMPFLLETGTGNGRISFVDLTEAASWQLPFVGTFGTENIPLNSSDQLEITESDATTLLTIDSTAGSPNTLDFLDGDAVTTLSIDLEAV